QVRQRGGRLVQRPAPGAAEDRAGRRGGRAAMTLQDGALLLLMYAVFPLWVAAGLADWSCHRRTRIEHTSGLAENAFHWALLAQVGLAALAVALLEVNAAV